MICVCANTKLYFKKMLLSIIENYRLKLIQVGIEEGLNSNKTLELSQYLDKLISIYQRL